MDLLGTEFRESSTYFVDLPWWSRRWSHYRLGPPRRHRRRLDLEEQMALWKSESPFPTGVDWCRPGGWTTYHYDHIDKAEVKSSFPLPREAGLWWSTRTLPDGGTAHWLHCIALWKYMRLTTLGSRILPKAQKRRDNLARRLYTMLIVAQNIQDPKVLKLLQLTA